MLNFEDCILFDISNKKYLSELLKIDLFKLKDVKKYYSTTPFLKKFPSGKTRLLYNPPKEYKLVLKRINSYLNRIHIPPYVFGGIKNRDYVKNAHTHIDNKHFLLVDLKDFFPSTSDSYVYDFFRNKLRMSKDISKICTLLVTESISETTEIRSLPQGYPTSPILIYLCYSDMYNKLQKLSLDNNKSFSCYYDDITFSSQETISKQFKKKIIGIIEGFDLKINKQKTQLRRIKNGVKITGTIIKHNTMTAPNKLQKKMYTKYNELLDLYSKTPDNTRDIKKLCNAVQGCTSAIRSIERNRHFPIIMKKLKEIRSLSKIPR